MVSDPQVSKKDLGGSGAVVCVLIQVCNFSSLKACLEQRCEL